MELIIAVKKHYNRTLKTENKNKSTSSGERSLL